VNAVLKPHRPESIEQANRLAEKLCVAVAQGQRGFAITETQRQMLFGLFRRAYLAGFHDKRKD
jgi:hypothetical protein